MSPKGTNGTIDTTASFTGCRFRKCYAWYSGPLLKLRPNFSARLDDLHGSKPGGRDRRGWFGQSKPQAKVFLNLNVVLGNPFRIRS